MRHYIPAMTYESLLLPTELDIERTSFDVDYYWRWIVAQRSALWFWQDWETAMAYLDWQIERN